MGKTFIGFEERLANFRNEVNFLVAVVYMENAVQHSAALSKRVLSRLNVTSQFWLVHRSACETAAFITLGRIFDWRSEFNVKRLVECFSESLSMFQRPSLEARRLKDQPKRPDYLDDYLNDAYYPTQADAKRLLRSVTKYSKLYNDKFGPARNRFYAHRASLDSNTNSKLFSGTT